MYKLYQQYMHCVNFNAEVPITVIRKAMVAENNEHFDQFYMFDDMQMFLRVLLENDKKEGDTVLVHLTNNCK